MTDELELLRRMRPESAIGAGLLEAERSRLMTHIANAPAGAASAPPTDDRPGEGAPAQRIVPHLVYDDVAAALDCLCRAFGFAEPAGARLVDPDGRVGHAALDVGGATVMLGPPSVHGDSPARGVSTMLALYVDDVDAHCARARAAGAEIVLEPADQPWGERRYQCRDPEGHQWSFHRRLAGRKG